MTKRDLADYYAEIGDAIVPHLRNRPFTLKRYPYGIRGQPYFHKQAPKGKPDWVPTRQFRTWPREGDSRLVDFTLVNEPAAVVWMVQMNCIDMNAWYSRVDKPDRPDYVVFDLDPPESRNGFAQAIRVAHLVREALDRLELRSYVKTSGADGIHVLVPITRRSSYPETYEFAELVSRGLEAENPGLVTTEWLKKKRRGVLVDHRQNGHGKTIASAYSVRPKPGAPVSTPLRWEELGEKVRPRDFGMREALRADREARRPVRAGARAAARRSGPALALAARVKRAVVIGSGPNGLAAAITLARAGRGRSSVHEAADTVGGGVRSEELTLPGLRARRVLGDPPARRVESPFFRDLELPVDWVHPPAPAAHPLDDGTAVAARALARRDGRAARRRWRRLPAARRAARRALDATRAGDRLGRSRRGRAALACARSASRALAGARAALASALRSRSAFRTERARALLRRPRGALDAAARAPAERGASASC